MVPSIPAILQTPWPERPSTRIVQRDEESLRHEAGETENRRALEEYRSQKSALQEEKLAVCPRLTLRLSDASTLSLRDGTLDFTATLCYTMTPEFVPSQPIVLHLLGPKAGGPLSENAVYWGQYQIFASPENLPEHRLPFEWRNVSLRRPRDANGRFIDSSDSHYAAAQTYVVSEAEGWIELFPGQEVSRRVTLQLDQAVAWQRGVSSGRDYWLRWAPSGTVGNPKTLWSWKYGGLKDWEGIILNKKEDSKCWIPIPIQSEESGLKFKVVDGAE